MTTKRLVGIDQIVSNSGKVYDVGTLPSSGKIRRIVGVDQVVASDSSSTVDIDAMGYREVKLNGHGIPDSFYTVSGATVFSSGVQGVTNGYSSWSNLYTKNSFTSGSTASFGNTSRSSYCTSTSNGTKILTSFTKKYPASAATNQFWNYTDYSAALEEKSVSSGSGATSSGSITAASDYTKIFNDGDHAYIHSRLVYNQTSTTPWNKKSLSSTASASTFGGEAASSYGGSWSWYHGEPCHIPCNGDYAFGLGQGGLGDFFNTSSTAVVKTHQLTGLAENTTMVTGLANDGDHIYSMANYSSFQNSTQKISWSSKSVAQNLSTMTSWNFVDNGLNRWPTNISIECDGSNIIIGSGRRRYNVGGDLNEERVMNDTRKSSIASNASSFSAYTTISGNGFWGGFVSA